MIVRILLLAAALGFGAMADPRASDAQPAGQIPRLGYLTPFQAATPGIVQFRQALRDLSYIEGQNIMVELREADGKLERLPALAADLVRLKVDLIVAVGNEGIQAAKDATGTIPIVMRFSTDDPVVSGFVASYGRPGGNITGVTGLSPGLEAKRLELLRDLVPGVTRVAVLVHPARATFQLNYLREAARSLGVRLQVVEARDASEYAGAFAAMTKERAGALVVLSNPVFFSDHKLLIDLATRHRLATMYAWPESAEAGGLMSYGPSFGELNRRAVVYIDRILKGTKPADLPVEGPTVFELVINLKTAKALGLRIPQALVQRADRVLQ